MSNNPAHQLGKSRRVVVTGLGVVSPLGLTIAESWSKLCQGKSGITAISRFDASAHASQIAGEVKGFEPTAYIEKKDIKKMDLFIQYAIAAGSMAIQDANLDLLAIRPERFGSYIGSGMGGLPGILEQHQILLEKGPRRISPFFIPMQIINMAAGQLAIFFNAKGPCSATATACASGAHAIGDAFQIISRNAADIMLAGGSEAVISSLAVAGFTSMKALSTRNNEPERASRPFDKERDGFVIGEGAGLLILEELEHALARKARIYAELIGYGMSCDAYHITAPSLDGDGATRCILAAIEDAGIKPEEIDYINAHGTSTPYNDKVETVAIKNVFGEKAYQIPVSSNKSMIGHLLGAAGGIEAIFTILTIYHDLIPPTINYEFPDPECDLDYVPNQARHQRVDVALTNSFGFGGTNACLIFKKYNKPDKN